MLLNQLVEKQLAEPASDIAAIPNVRLDCAYRKASAAAMPDEKDRGHRDEDAQLRGPVSPRPTVISAADDIQTCIGYGRCDQSEGADEKSIRRTLFSAPR